MITSSPGHCFLHAFAHVGCSHPTLPDYQLLVIVVDLFIATKEFVQVQIPHTLFGKRVFAGVIKDLRLMGWDLKI